MRFFFFCFFCINFCFPSYLESVCLLNLAKEHMVFTVGVSKSKEDKDGTEQELGAGTRLRELWQTVLLPGHLEVGGE